MVVSVRGLDYSTRWRDYSWVVRRELRKWKPELAWAPKDLRNCLTTFARLEGLDADIVDQYSGRVARGVAARHYLPKFTAVSAGEREALETQMECLREKVTKPLNRAIAGKEKAEILNIFERPEETPLTSSKSSAHNSS